MTEEIILKRRNKLFNKYLEKCPKSLTITEMQIESALGSHLTQNVKVVKKEE